MGFYSLFIKNMTSSSHGHIYLQLLLAQFSVHIFPKEQEHSLNAFHPTVLMQGLKKCKTIFHIVWWSENLSGLQVQIALFTQQVVTWHF